MVNKRDYSSQLDLIQSVLKESPELKTNVSIARVMKEKGAEHSINHLRLLLASYFEDHPRAEAISTVAEKEVPYTVVDNEYQIVSKNGVILIPVSRVDDLFFDYSEHGRNLQSTQMINKYDFEVWEWNAIKSRLRLYKKSNIYSPYTVENTPKEEMELMIKAKLQHLTDTMGEMIEKEYSKHILSQAKKVLVEKEKLSLFDKFFLTTERDPDQAPPVIKVSQNQEPVNNGHLVVAIADPHFGAKTIGSKMITDYDREQSITWMNTVAKNINDRSYDKVSLLLAGDYIESFTGTNHANSFQGMEYGIFGAKAYFNAVDILSEFVGNVNNVEQVIGVSGNHDRGDGRRDVDPKGEIGLMILEQLKRNFEMSCPVEYDSMLMYKEIDGIGYGLTHGHNSISKKKGEDLTFDYGNNKIYNVWVQGHLHEFKVLQNTVKVLKVVSPSIFPGNYYSESLGFNSNPGYMEFENNGSGKATMKVSPLFS